MTRKLPGSTRAPRRKRLPPLRTYDDLLPLFTKYVGSMSRALPADLREDYCQDMFIGLMRARFMEHVDPSDRERAKSYLHNSLKNLTFNWHRWHARHWALTDLVDPLEAGLDLPGAQSRHLTIQRLHDRLRGAGPEPHQSAAGQGILRFKEAAPLV